MALKHSVGTTIFVALLGLAVSNSHASQFVWPGGAKTAVILTYDDTLNSHLDHAIPQLNNAGLKGTFYISGARTQLSQRMQEWRAAAARGHELGNHTLYHSCKKSNPGRDWVAEHHDLDRYTVTQFEEEVRVTNTLLQAIDGKRQRTFAYPCGDTDVNGGNSIISALKKHVSAARFGSPPLSPTPQDVHASLIDGLDDPMTMNRYMINAMDGANLSGAQLINAAERSLSSGKMMTYLFHGIVDQGEYLTTTTEAHQALVTHLQENPSSYWVAPLQDVIEYIDSQMLKK